MSPGDGTASSMAFWCHGETLARCFERKRFVEFQGFLRMLFGSVWCRRFAVST